MCRVNDTPRQRETEGDRERESVCEYTNEEDFQFNFIQKSRHREREREREVFWSRAHFVAESVPKAPVATTRTTCQRRVLAERLLSHSSATPPPTSASFSKRAPRPKTHASIFPSGFPPLIIKVPLPFWWDPLTLSRKKTTRKNPCASSLPRARTSSPFLARENRRRRN